MTPQQRETHVSEDRMIDIVYGLVEGGERTQLLGHITECTECEARFRVVAGGREQALARPAPRIRNGRIRIPGRGGLHKRSLGGVALVAVFALAVILPFALRQAVPHVPEPYWLPVEDAQMLLRTQPQDIPEGYRDGLEAYRTRNVELARELLDRPYGLTGGPETRRLLYLASAHLHADAPHDAVAIIEQMPLEALPAPWRQRAQWMLYSALVATGDHDGAKDVLQELVRDPGEFEAEVRAARDT